METQRPHSVVKDLDIVFVGGGFSATMTLVHLIREFTDRRQPPEGALSYAVPIRIALLDRDGEFGCGAPYGRLAHPMFLLNENVATMNFSGLLDWLSVHRGRWLELLRAKPYPGVMNWLSRNALALEAARTDPASYLSLYFPRCIFGLFVRELLQGAIADACRTSVARVELIRGDATSIERLCDGGFTIRLADGGAISSRLVILALGSLPPEPAAGLEGVAGYVHDLVRRSPEAALKEVREQLESSTSVQRCVAILGSNAEAMEAVYAIRNDTDLAEVLDEIVLISESGCLPGGTVCGRQPAFTARNLKRLVERHDVSAHAILNAATADAEFGRRSGYTSLDYSGPICHAFSEAFVRLSFEERRRFVEECGAQFTALNRHSPPEYAAAAEFFQQGGRLRLVRARVTAVERLIARRAGFTIRAIGTSGAELLIGAAAVINCRGSGSLPSNQTPLLGSILRPGSSIAHVNRSNMGIAVNVDFEASSGVFVMGPLLSGHATRRDAIWNLESAPRIHSLSERLAGIVASRVR